MVLRIIGSSLLTAALGAVIGFLLFGRYPEATAAEVLFGIVGAFVGAIAGAAREIAAASRPSVKS